MSYKLRHTAHHNPILSSLMNFKACSWRDKLHMGPETTVVRKEKIINKLIFSNKDTASSLRASHFLWMNVNLIISEEIIVYLQCRLMENLKWWTISKQYEKLMEYL